MVAEIYLPDGTPAFIDETGWCCPDTSVLPVLHYLTKKIPGDVSTMNVAQIARAVVAMMNGARFRWTDLEEQPLRPANP